MDSAKIEVLDSTLKESNIDLTGIDFISSGNQYLSFTLGEENFCIDILTVKEIRGWERPTRLPNSPEHIKGVTNLRGVIVPIIDLRLQFSIGTPTYTPTTVVVVLSNNSKNSRTMGFVVDAVSDVLNVDDEDISPPPAFLGSIGENYIVGIISSDNNAVTLLDVEQLLHLEDSHDSQ